MEILQRLAKYSYNRIAIIKPKFLDHTNNPGIINLKMALSLKYLINFWRALERLLTNCEINLILTWSAHSVISEGNRITVFPIINTKLYLPVVKFPTQYKYKTQNYCNNRN